MGFKRVKWKGILLNNNILIKAKKRNKKPVKVLSRNSIITPLCLGRTFEIYNGFKYIKVVVSDNMIGHKFGEFSPTRVKAVFKKK